MSPTLGIIQPGSTYADMVERFGDYDTWFRAILEPAGVRCHLYRADLEELPDFGEADGWLVTGGRGAAYDADPWVQALLKWIRVAVEEEAPLLGVCYGHQALCAAMGGEVVLNPAGWELGTTVVDLTEAGREDPLFRGFSDRFRVQTTHQDHVSMAPTGADLLATNEHTPIQAVAVGPRARGVQFHPEVTTVVSQDYVDRRGHKLDEPPVVTDAPQSPAVLLNFVDGFVLAPLASRRPWSRPPATTTP